MGRTPTHAEIGVREEAINTKLAQLLSEGGTLHIPESILVHLDAGVDAYRIFLQSILESE
jgi:hypothetical protein